MSKKKALEKFLSFHPWTSQPVLEYLFGPDLPELANKKQFRRLTVPGIGTGWGVIEENISSLPGIHRREIAKTFLCKNYGKDLLWAGASPGAWGSDLLVFMNNEEKSWMRVWVDLGKANVETLVFIHQSPDRTAPNISDLILTPSIQRAELIKLHISANWKQGIPNLKICAMGDTTFLPGEDRRYSEQQFFIKKPLEKQEVQSLLEKQRQKRQAYNQEEIEIGKFFLRLQEIDFKLLTILGDNPLFSIPELSYLISHAATGTGITESRQNKALQKAMQRYLKLENLGLIKKAANSPHQTKVSKVGLEVLANYWGTSQEQLRRFQSWPQKKDSDGDLFYSENALLMIEEHTREVQRFVLGLVDNAARLARPYGGVDVFVDTIVGKRIYFQDLATRQVHWVVPDAVIVLSYWRRTWRDGLVQGPKILQATREVLLEFDRDTGSIPKSREKIVMYGRIWHKLPGNPVQAWVIDGTPWREKEILKAIREAGIEGWTVPLDRLKLEEDDPWWETNFQLDGNLPYQKHHGYAPLRKIWRSPEDYRMHTLLDQAPWRQEMSLSQPVTRVPRSY